MLASLTSPVCKIVYYLDSTHEGPYCQKFATKVEAATLSTSTIHTAMYHGIGTSREGCWGPPVWAAWGGEAFPGVGGSYRGLLPAGPPLEKRISSVSAFQPGPPVPRPLEPWLQTAPLLLAGIHLAMQLTVGFFHLPKNPQLISSAASRRQRRGAHKVHRGLRGFSS